MKLRNLFKFAAAALAAVSVFVSCGEKPEEPTPVEPEVKTPVLSMTGSEAVIAAAADTYEIPFLLENPAEGKKASVSIPEGISWIIAQTVEGDKMKITVTDNLSSDRSATLTLSYPGAKDLSFTLIQKQWEYKEFTIEMSKPTPFGATFTVKRNDAVYTGGYFFEIISKKGVDKYLSGDPYKMGEFNYGERLYQSDLEYLEGLAAQHGHSLAELFGMLQSMYCEDSSVEMPYSTLSVDTDYYFIVYGMEKGTAKRLTPICLYQFRTEHSDASGLAFAANATDITETSAVINITPSNNDEYWYWDYVSEIDRSKYSLDFIMQHTVSNLKEYLSSYTWDQILMKGKIADYQITNLLQGTKYTIVAWGMDLEGNPTTEPMEILAFTTKDIEVIDDCTFDIEILTVEDMDVQVRVTPSNVNTVYYTAFVEESKMEGYSDEQAAQRIINMEATRLANGTYGENVTWENLPGLASGTKEIWGRRDYDWTFLPEHTYHIYVFGIDGMGIRSTRVARKDVTTASATASSNHFSVEFNSMDWRSVTYTITPEINDEKWMPFLIETKEIDSYYRNADGSLNEAGIMEEIQEYYEDEIVYHNYEGPKTLTDAWTPGTEYTLLVFGYAGTNTTMMYAWVVTSPEPPLGKSSADFSYTYELFRADDLIAMDPRVWPENEFAGQCIMVARINPTENAKHWYWGVWPPVQNFANEGGIYYLMKLDMNENASFVDKKFARILPWWYGSQEGYVWVDEDGDIVNHYPWSISGWAEDENGDYGPWHYELFIPVPVPRGQETGKYEVGYTEAYDFWSGSSSSGVKIYSTSTGKEINPGK